MTTSSRRDPPSRPATPTGWLRRSARNALELLAGGRITSPELAPHRVEHTGAHFRLRHYAGAVSEQAPLLLVPPLMVTAEIYDISPELSAVAFLADRGMDVWSVDFGAPEHEQGGLQRTLDDHLLAVNEAIDEVARRTGRDVHLVGYSQGGLFVYQVAAYRRSRGVASVITMGSPVDMRRNLPVRVHQDLVERTTRAARDVLQRPLELIDGLPGELTSMAFKLLSIRKELDQYVQLLTILPDREAVTQWRNRRQFLGGGGFVAWPGPALRNFIDEVMAMNRLTSGGFVVNGRIVTLGDITCPVLCFVGLTDDLAYPAAVRAIHRAASGTTVQEVGIRAGHFGLVVGSRAFGVTWPTVISWVTGDGVLPHGHDKTADAPQDAPAPRRRTPAPVVRDLWQRLGRLGLELTGLIDVARWERPRRARLAHVHTRMAFGPGVALARTAAETPDDTFFLWRNRAYTHGEGHTRVQQLAAQMQTAGLRATQRVALELGQTPDYLSLVCAISTLGAELYPAAAGSTARPPDQVEPFDLRLTELAALPTAQGSSPLPVHHPAPGNLALDLRTGSADDSALRLSNRAWAAAALHTAAVCRLKPTDTLYSSLPLHHPLALLCALPPSLIARTRLALGERFTPVGFWQDVRRYGASVVFLSSDMTTSLLAEHDLSSAPSHSIRCAVLEGPTPSDAQALSARFRIPLVVGAELRPGGPDHPSPLRLTPLRSQ